VRHADAVGVLGVAGAVAAVDDLDIQIGDEPVDGRDSSGPGLWGRLGCDRRLKMRRQAVTLVAVEDNVVLQEGDALLAGSTAVVDGLLGEGVVVADGRSLLTLADMTAEI